MKLAWIHWRQWNDSRLKVLVTFHVQFFCFVSLCSDIEHVCIRNKMRCNSFEDG